jgi:hypothetical protein
MYRLDIEYINLLVLRLVCTVMIGRRKSIEVERGTTENKESVHKVCPLSISLSSFNGLDLGKE